jgi:hypothetical protein
MPEMKNGISLTKARMREREREREIEREREMPEDDVTARGWCLRMM